MSCSSFRSFGAFASLLFILGWWWLAFHADSPASPRLSKRMSSSHSTAAAPYLQPLSRARLHQALLGDTALMLSLMAEWDIEAQLLTTCGVSEVRRLAPEAHLRAQLLGRRVLAAPLEASSARVLPQTYVSAAFLLALASPEQIVALPKGFRDLTQLFPINLLEQIALDSSPHHMEEIYLARPNLAIVAPYSLPATRQALMDKGIELLTISHVETFEDIQNAIRQVGHAIGQPDKAELLALFMEAAIYALDNRLGSRYDRDVLYLNYFSKFSTPTRSTLTGYMLQRLGINRYAVTTAQNEHAWQVPLEQETIAQIGPKAIIIAAAQGGKVKEILLHSAAFRNIPAVQQGRIEVLDEATQNFPSQFAVLAYYDLIQTLEGFRS